jgi:chemotaxis protein MotB
MARAKKKAEGGGGAPEWVVTYGDMMSLLLCFFIILVAMSELKRDDQQKIQQVMESLRRAFGNTGEIRAVISDSLDPNALLKKLREIVIPPKVALGDAEDPGVKGKAFRVTDIREGIHVEIGGRVTFERFSATLSDTATYLIEQTAAKTVGHNLIIKITGHATNEPLPPDSVWHDAWNLSFARARAVADVMIRSGIKESRIRLVAAGSEAPVIPQAYTEDERALNRRVEIVVTEAMITDYVPETYSRERQESTDGGT